ncbi:MAG: hypothetical protein HOV94_40420 [Saccharothrix sp.]|nr:hypothetical protein [Saccharothrix sp.]
MRAFRWLPYGGRRHAIPDTLAANDEGRTLCGVEVTVPHDPPPRCPDGCWPTCHDCDVAWREHEGIPLFPRPRATGDNRLAVAKGQHAELGERS